ncbi:hypothetical protein [Anaerotignum sp. MB30-C6]|uniref:hypothetical protein n=1 Tax=Anaerotignum sp. MB30-C6 TaxID=3070814 RepID=UPI0027DAD16A|nr:hypothetical protein [Anaerotignum sp. MB30-C6]WMI81465.1 hypothetical protein RBQ60_01660 [Anaerotignum sp. MB30-C6]
MLDSFLALSWQDIVIAASIAYVVFSVIRRLQRAFGKNESEFSHKVRNMDMVDVYEKCKELFPIQNLTFHGKEFSRGMHIKVITIQKKIIEGELIGINKVNLICIRTHNQIIAHQLEKVEEIIGLE